MQELLKKQRMSRSSRRPAPQLDPPDHPPPAAAGVRREGDPGASNIHPRRPAIQSLKAGDQWVIKDGQGGPTATRLQACPTPATLETPTVFQDLEIDGLRDRAGER